MDKPVKTRPPLTDLIPIAILKPDDEMTFEWLEDLINALRVNAGLEPLTSEELNSPWTISSRTASTPCARTLSLTLSM